MASAYCEERDQRREMGQRRAVIRPGPGSARGQLQLGGQNKSKQDQIETVLFSDLHKAGLMREVIHRKLTLRTHPCVFNVIMWCATAPVPLDDYRRWDRTVCFVPSADAAKPAEYSIRNLHLCIRLLPRTSNPRALFVLERLQFKNIMQFPSVLYNKHQISFYFAKGVCSCKTIIWLQKIYFLLFIEAW